ncbi:ergothioneine biosynthesis protein EgtC [Saccharomonospora piscinae]|uniref:ergothioneine biosynthesis protein EgtC n=1 Tax=Saccharomonospora piscinae TaxID=687388 RepID=UPI00046603A6|nr:ergothioneine biosynthesis protein EgtC [Saccharomonospora piscinae]
MCRHLAYLGPPVSPSDAVLRAPHSLLVQSYAPLDMRGGGTVNVDGFGVGWFAGDGYPTRYRRADPIWTDGALPRLLEPVRTGSFLAAVRSGTPGMPVTETACAPFADDDWLFSHNGVVLGWPESMARLAAEIPVVDLLHLDAPTDSALLWRALRFDLRRGRDPVAAVADLSFRVEAGAPGSRLNLLLAGRDLLVATAWSHSLSVRTAGGGVLVASEPCDGDPAWQAVADGDLVVARRTRGADENVEPTVEISTVEKERSQA